MIFPPRLSSRKNNRMKPFSVQSFVLLSLAAACSANAVWCAESAQRASDAFPEFIVPGHEAQMEQLRELFRLHHSPRSRCSLWDAWLPMSVLWPAIGAEESADAMRAFYRESLLTRPIDEEGYVSTRQHRGLAHSEGWPFPLWTQAGGIGWHFSLAGDAYGQQHGARLATSLDGWELAGIENRGIDPRRGLTLALGETQATLTTPAVDVDTFVSPFVRLEWAFRGMASDARPYLAWTSAEEPQFDAGRRVFFKSPSAEEGLAYSNVRMYDHPLWTGRFTRLRIGFENSGPAEVTVKSLITAVDSRHPTNNSVFVQACCDYFNWTGDGAFLRESLPRMRSAVAYSIREFATRENGCVLVPWIGHCGRTGFVTLPGGGKKLFNGRGVGNNYWDLLPFGHKDCLATIYLYAALCRMADLERKIESHPEWSLPGPEAEWSAAALRRHVEDIRARAGKVFWNENTGRFAACIDADGAKHDYGYTFLNLEAIFYGFADPAQARSILDWVGGARTVEGDTAAGEDIYHWRFAPRASTRRNVDWYMWVWHRPESIPWGGQVQDGGAVLGFSYHDLATRIQTLGPDDAWRRLQAILDWFAEVRAEGGYRAYYARPGRGTLQGGGTPGGLGLDHEFMESVLVPQIMVYGFLGFRPSGDGFALRPQLPADWPSLAVTRIHVQNQVIDVTAAAGRLTIHCRRAGTGPLRVELVPGAWSVQRRSAAGQAEKAETQSVDREHPAIPLQLASGESVVLLGPEAPSDGS